MAQYYPSISTRSGSTQRGHQSLQLCHDRGLRGLCTHWAKPKLLTLLLFGLLCFLTRVEANAERPIESSIRQLIDKQILLASQATSAKSQISTYRAIATAYCQLGRPDSAIIWCEIGAKANDGKLPYYYRLLLAEYYRQLARYDKVIEVLKPFQIVSYTKEGIEEQFWVGIFSARASLNLGDYQTCYQYLKQAKSYLPKLNDQRALGWWSLGMSHFMGSTYRDDSARYYQAEVLRLSKLANDPYLIVEHRLAVANTLFWSGNFSAMKVNLGQAETKISQAIGDDVYLKMQVLALSADYYLSTKNPDSSRSICYQLLAIAKKVNNKEMIGVAYNKLANAATEPALALKRLDLMDSAQAYFRANGSVTYLPYLYHNRLSLINQHKLISAVRLDELIQILDECRVHFYNIQRAVSDKIQDDYSGLMVSYQDANHQISKLKYGLLLIGFLSILTVGGFGYQLAKAKQKSRLMMEQLHAKDLAIKTLEAQVQQVEIKTGYDMVRHEIDQTKHELNEVISEVHRKEHLLIELEQALRSVPRLNNNIDDLLASYKKNDISLDDDWDTLISNFEILRPQFFKRLAKQGPGLSRLDLKVCALMVMNVNSRAIAEMLNITEPSLRNRRSIIRKKLGLERDQELSTYLNNLQ